VCIDTRHENCDGTVSIGKCPGSSNIKCCSREEEESTKVKTCAEFKGCNSPHDKLYGGLGENAEKKICRPHNICTKKLCCFRKNTRTDSPTESPTPPKYKRHRTKRYTRPEAQRYRTKRYRTKRHRTNNNLLKYHRRGSR